MKRPKHRLAMNLLLLRNKSGISQAGVSWELEERDITIGQKSIAQYETGGCEPGIDKIKAFADYYNVTMDLLCYGTEQQLNDHLNTKA